MTPMRLVDMARGLDDDGGGHILLLLVERHAHRVEQSQQVLQKLGGDRYATVIRHQVADVGDPDGVDLRDYDAVYFAILLGSTQEEKERLLLSVVSRMRKGAV